MKVPPYFNLKKHNKVKTILLILVFLISATSYAQTPISATLVSQYSNSVDTVDNTETIYLSLTTANASKVATYFKAGTVVFKALEVSGTGAGTATLQVSANGTDFANAPAQYTADTAYSIVDQTTVQTYAWRLSNFAAKAIRIKITGSGTMSYKVYGSAFLSN